MREEKKLGAVEPLVVRSVDYWVPRQRSASSVPSFARWRVAAVQEPAVEVALVDFGIAEAVFAVVVFAVVVFAVVVFVAGAE